MKIQPSVPPVYQHAINAITIYLVFLVEVVITGT